ncbi:unnamed protein product, partial [Mesorhabditis spiculigera]
MLPRALLRLSPGTSQQRPFSRSAPALNAVLNQFFDDPQNFGKTELRPKLRPGRAWSSDELRRKSNEDLHKLWYICLKERNMLLTMQKSYQNYAKAFPNPERLDNVATTMKGIEEVVHERNDAYYQLETGKGVDPPKRTITSFMGFTYEKAAREHYQPPTAGQKEYEVPELDADAHMMQKLWAEKEALKERDRKDVAAQREYLSDSKLKFKRGGRRTFDRLEDIKPYL